jgi:hypothetical protein
LSRRRRILAGAFASLLAAFSLIAVLPAVPAVPPASAESGGAATQPPPDNGAETPIPEAGNGKPADAVRAETPGWGKGHETLSYRLTFLGVTAGYARFTILGKTIVDGRHAWHLHVRGWTSQFLSVFYPVNNIMDYYLDVKTLVPIRIAVTKNERKKFTDEIILYDQEKGQITYWDRAMKNMEKRVDVVPEVHDPVTAVYYFRTRDAGNPDRSRNVYAGRKMWQIASRSIGTETIPDEFGRPVETTVIKPVIRRDGKLENKGDIKMWLTNDDRKVPLRIYADIKFGTVVGQLIPPQEGG